MTRSFSRHGLLDLYGCNPALLRDEGYLKTILAAAAEAAQATVLDSRFHTFGGAGGVTGVLLLAELHISIHTWPEYGFAAVDVFLCGRMPSENARRVLEEALGAKRAEWRNIPRGNAASVAGNPLGRAAVQLPCCPLRHERRQHGFQPLATFFLRPTCKAHKSRFIIAASVHGTLGA